MFISVAQLKHKAIKGKIQAKQTMNVNLYLQLCFILKYNSLSYLWLV